MSISNVRLVHQKTEREYLKMELHILGKYNLEYHMGKEQRNIQIISSMLGITLMVKNMDKVHYIFKMDLHMKENMKMD